MDTEINDIPSGSVTDGQWKIPVDKFYKSAPQQHSRHSEVNNVSSQHHGGHKRPPVDKLSVKQPEKRTKSITTICSMNEPCNATSARNAIGESNVTSEDYEFHAENLHLFEHVTTSTPKPKFKTSSSQTNLYLSANTPRKRKLRKKLHASQLAANRRKGSILKLKKKCSEKLAKIYGSDIDKVLQDIGKYLKGDAFNFVEHQIRMCQHPPKGRRYTDEVKLLSLALYNSGPKAYAYLADIFVLPSKFSLSKWLNNMQSSPGFINEMFDALSERLKFMADRDKVCSLMIDEVSLKKHLQYDSLHDVIVGYEDFGSQFDRSKDLAGNALVFMLRGIAARWNQPVGYVFTKTACAPKIVKALILECIEKCEKNGCKLQVIVSDQGSNFQSLVSELGITPQKPYFYHKGNRYFYMYDPPHLLKSVRNNLSKYTFQFGNKKATWDVIKEYYKIDVTQKYRLTPKLTDNHIYLPPFSKMKVKWAAQVLSKSLAAALETHAKVIG